MIFVSTRTYFLFILSSACRISWVSVSLILVFTINTMQHWQSSWICYLFTVGILKHSKEFLSFFSTPFLPDAQHYQIRGKHVFPNAVISQRYKLQPYHNEKGMQSAAFSINSEDVYRIYCRDTAATTMLCYMDGRERGKILLWTVILLQKEF